MTPSDFKQARQTLGHSQRAMARTLGKGFRTIQRWESGKVPINLHTAFFVSNLLEIHNASHTYGKDGA